MKIFPDKSINPVLVFNCHYNGLSIIQALGRQKIPVYALDAYRDIGTFSRYAKFWKCPDPLKDEKSFINFLLEKVALFSCPPVLFPTNDHWAMAISKYKSKLGKFCFPCVADWEVVRLILNKDKFTSWAFQKGYPVPRTYPVEEIIRNKYIEFPIVAKPISRRFLGSNKNAYELAVQLDKIRMILIRDKASFVDFIHLNQDLLPYIFFQEYVPGMAHDMYTVGIYANKKHQVLGIFTGKKVRGFPPDIGDCIIGQVEKLPPALINIVKDMVKDIKYTGIAEFEFKKNCKTSEYKLIEVNPRSWSWIGITPYCGVNLPLIAYYDLTGIKNVKYQECKLETGEVKYVKILQDFLNCLFGYKKIGFPKYHLSFRQWLKSLKAKKIVLAEFALDDPIPGLYALCCFLTEIVPFKN